MANKEQDLLLMETRRLLKGYREDWVAMRGKGLSIPEERNTNIKLLDKYEKLLTKALKAGYLSLEEVGELRTEDRRYFEDRITEAKRVVTERYEASIEEAKKELL